MARTVEQYRDKHIRPIITGLIDRFVEKGRMELTSAYSDQIPPRVLMSLFAMRGGGAGARRNDRCHRHAARAREKPAARPGRTAPGVPLSLHALVPSAARAVRSSLIPVKWIGAARPEEPCIHLAVFIRLMS